MVSTLAGTGGRTSSRKPTRTPSHTRTASGNVKRTIMAPASLRVVPMTCHLRDAPGPVSPAYPGCEHQDDEPEPHTLMGPGRGGPGCIPGQAGKVGDDLHAIPPSGISVPGGMMPASKSSAIQVVGSAIFVRISAGPRRRATSVRTGSTSPPSPSTIWQPVQPCWSIRARPRWTGSILCFDWATSSAVTVGVSPPSDWR